MKMMWIAALCLVVSAPALTQTPDNEPASRDDIILYLRTMHSHDMMRKVLEVQSKSMQQLFHDQLLKEKGKLPPDFEVHMQKSMAELVKDMPLDEITQAVIPAYQKHFTKSDIEAMNAFYSSAVGQKVLEELPAVMQESMQAAMPILSKYLSDWKARMTRTKGNGSGSAETSSIGLRSKPPLSQDSPPQSPVLAVQRVRISSSSLMSAQV